MDEDDPFFISKPDTKKKMSTYLKKQGTGTKQCVETSSHGTNSTRSTANSTDLSGFSSKQSNDHNNSRSNKSSNSGFGGSTPSANSSLDFSNDFGNGLEFGAQAGSKGGSGFGSSDPFADFGTTSSSSKNNNGPPSKPRSTRKVGGGQQLKPIGNSTDAFEAFGGGGGAADDGFGGGGAFGTGGGNDAFGGGASDGFGDSRHDPFVEGGGGDAFGGGGDAFGGGGDAFGGGGDAFGSGGNAFGGGGDAFGGGGDAFGGSGDPFGGGGFADDAFGGDNAFEGSNNDVFAGGNGVFEEGDVDFGDEDDEDYDEDDEVPSSNRDIGSFIENDDSKEGDGKGKSRSHGPPSRPARPGERRRGGIRRHHSSDLTNDCQSVQSFRSEGHMPSRRTHDKNPSSGKERERERIPPGRTRSNRRRPMGNSSSHGLDASEDKGDGGETPSRPRSSRKGLGHTRSDGSMEPAAATTTRSRPGPPARHKSSGAMRGAHRSGPPQRARSTTAAIYSSSRREARPARRGSNDPITELEDAAESAPASGEGAEKKGDWAKERSRNQELIMNMYRSEGLEKKDSKNDSSTKLDVDMEAMQVQDSFDDSAGKLGFGQRLMKGITGAHQSLDDDHAQAGAPSSRDSRPSGRGRADRSRPSKSKSMVTEGSSYANRIDEGRSKASLLERVGGDLGSEKRSSSRNNDSSTDDKGLSYSDKILMASSRGKR